jgi:hypothetical protein
VGAAIRINIIVDTIVHMIACMVKSTNLVEIWKTVLSCKCTNCNAVTATLTVIMRMTDNGSVTDNACGLTK